MAKRFFGGFFGGGITGVTPSRGVTQKLIEKSMNIYRECGGTKFDDEKGLNDDLTEGLSAFDGMKIVLHGKLKKTRETIKDLRNAGRRFQSHEKLKNDIRKMVRNLEHDMNKIREFHEKTKKPNLMQKFLKIKPQDDKMCEAREEEIRLMELHVEEVKNLSQARYRAEAKTGGGRSYQGTGEDNKEKKRVKKLLNNDSSSDSDSDTDTSDSEANSDKSFDSDVDKVVDPDGVSISVVNEGSEDGEEVEGELPEDPTKSQLPPISIQAAVDKVKENKKELNKILNVFEEKLEVVLEMAEQIGEQLDEQSDLIDEAQEKVEIRKAEIDKLNDKIDKVNAKASKGTRLVVLICCFICCTVMMVITYFVLLQTGVLSW